MAAENQTSIKADLQNNYNNSKMAGKSMPMFISYDTNARTMTETLKTILGHNEFNLRVLNKTVTFIVLCVFTDYNKLVYYTFTPGEKLPTPL